MSRRPRVFRVLRSPRGGEEAGRPALRGFEVLAGEGWTVLDALEAIRLGQDPTLGYRHSCHHSACGTCACRVSGEERLTCVTRLGDLPEGPVVLEPLRGFEVVADLAVDPAPLFANLAEDWSSLRPAEVPEAAGPRADGSPPERFEDCIECGCCVSACPVSAETPRFLGPAALAALSREIEKRPDREAELLAIAASDRGEALCERHVECSRRCPTGVSPARHIAMLRRRLGRG